MHVPVLLPVHLVAVKSRLRGQEVAFIGPPAVHADLFCRYVLCPIGNCIAWRACRRGRVSDLSVEVMGRNHVQHDFEVVSVQLLQHHCRIWKDIGVKRERTMPGIPSRWTKAGT